MDASDSPSPEECLLPTTYLDADHPDVIAFVDRVCGEAEAATERERAVALFLAVRDGIRYDPYAVGGDRDSYRASAVVHESAAYCIPKAILLSAACRAAGIPARLGFADVRNHLQSAKLRERMGTDVFAFHGYSELWLGGRWLKVSSAFNRELCDRFGTVVLDFDGEHDALMHPFDQDGNRHMEYVRTRGSYADLPFDEIMAGFAEVYGHMEDDATGTNADQDDAFRP